MNILATTNTNNPAAVRQLIMPPRPWWNDRSLVALVRRGPFRDCNADEFDQAVAFCKVRNLSPLTGQLFTWVFNKNDEARRNMVLVTSLMGYRAIANRSGDYMPGQAKAYFDDAVKDEMTNPRGIVRAEATVKRFIHGGWQELTEEALWESFAPIVKGGDDDFTWEPTGEKYPVGHKKAGKDKYRKKPKEGVTILARLDPKKDGWIKMPDVMLKKIPEAQGLRRGWPEEMSGLYIEEEIHRSQAIDAEYIDITPSEMVEKADADKRLARIGGADQIGATFDASNDIVYVPVGQFADKVIEATARMKPAEVADWQERNTEALRYFWGKSATDALALKKVLETRSAGAAGERQQPSQPADDAAPATTAPSIAPAGAVPLLSKQQLVDELKTVKTKADHLAWAQKYKVDVNALPPKDRDDLMDAFHGMRDELVK